MRLLSLSENAFARGMDREYCLRWTSQIPVILAAACLAAGCESFDVLSPQQSAALLNKVQVGMTKTEVIDQLGQPQKQEARGATELLFYRTIWQVADQAKLRTPIAVRDGIVVGFGETYSENPAGSPRAAWDAWLIDVRPME
jgi:hypothetical protein